MYSKEFCRGLQWETTRESTSERVDCDSKRKQTTRLSVQPEQRRVIVVYSSSVVNEWFNIQVTAYRCQALELRKRRLVWKIYLINSWNKLNFIKFMNYSGHHHYCKIAISLGNPSTLVLQDTWRARACNVSNLSLRLHQILSKHNVGGGVSCLDHWLRIQGRLTRL